MMMKFIDALLNRNTRTENGMVTNSTSLNPCVDLFFTAGALRAAGAERMVSTFSAAYAADRLTALRLLFWARDVRGGAGERAFFRACLGYLATVDPAAVIANVHLVPEYGRWDDLLVLFGTAAERAALDIIAAALRAGDQLCAKWMPRPGSARNDAANTIRRFMRLTPAGYRSLLVEATNVVETLMCARAWEIIDYATVPSVAMTRYGRAFGWNDAERFNRYKADLVAGKATVNAGAIYPHDVIRSLQSAPENLAIAQAQWQAIPLLYDPAAERVLPICDVSGSMGFQVSPGLSALTVCISLGMYIAERNVGPYRDCFITFSNEPKLQQLRGNLLERLAQLQMAEWGMSTDLHRVFNLILDQAVRYNVAPEEMPTRLLILSDMEFNQCASYDDSAIEMIERKYRKAGYSVPGIVFWNLQSRHSNVPVRYDRKNVALVSGFSPNVLAMTLGNIDPVLVMRRAVDSERYQAIRLPEMPTTA